MATMAKSTCSTHGTPHLCPRLQPCKTAVQTQEVEVAAEGQRATGAQAKAEAQVRVMCMDAYDMAGSTYDRVMLAR